MQSAKNLVDYFAAHADQRSRPTAPSLFIKKFKGDGTTALGGATFKISPNPLPVGTAGRPADNFLTIFDDSDANTALDGGNYDDPDATAGLISLPVVVPGVEYTITETAAPDGWILDGTVVKKTPVAFGTAQGTTNTATFVNHRGSVKFYKDYAGADPQTGASFTLTRDNADADALYNNGTVHVTDNGANDSDNTIGVIKVDPLDAGSWKLVEDDPGAPTGWLRDTTEVLFTVPDGQGNRDVVLANPTLSDPRATYPLEVKKIGVVPNQADVDVAGAVFNLWRDTNGTAGLQKATDTLAGTCTTAANGKCSVLNQPWGFNYFWEEVSVPAPWNLPSVTVQGPVTLNANGSTNPSGPTVFSDPKSKIVTQATNGNLPNATISDTATLSGVNNSAAGTGEVRPVLHRPDHRADPELVHPGQPGAGGHRGDPEPGQRSGRTTPPARSRSPRPATTPGSPTTAATPTATWRSTAPATTRTRPRSCRRCSRESRPWRRPRTPSCPAPTSTTRPRSPR